MKDGLRVSGLAAGVLSLALQGCATHDHHIPVIPAYPAQAADNDPQVLVSAIDNLAMRMRAAGFDYTRTQYSNRTVLQAQFDEVALLDKFKNLLYDNLAPTSNSDVAICVSDHVIQSAFWDIQGRIREPREGGASSIFTTTWKNVAYYCGGENSGALKADVNENWRRAARVIDSIQFTRGISWSEPRLIYTPR